MRWLDPLPLLSLPGPLLSLPAQETPGKLHISQPNVFGAGGSCVAPGARLPHIFPSGSVASPAWLRRLTSRLSCFQLCSPMNCSTPGFPIHHQELAHLPRARSNLSIPLLQSWQLTLISSSTDCRLEKEIWSLCIA